MATTSPASASRYSSTATVIAITGVAVATAGLIHLGVAYTQETTLELIGVLRGSSPKPDTAVAPVLNPWGLWPFLIGAAMAIVATVAKVFHRSSKSFPLLH